MNMLSLFVLGGIIEAFYRPVRMAAIFALACVAGAATSYLFTPVVSLGASTGVMGLLGALLAHNWAHRRHLPPRINRRYPFLLAILVVQVWLDLGSRQTDLFGHLGGLLGGAAASTLFASRLSGPVQAGRDRLPLPAAAALAFALLAYGGFGLFSSLPEQAELLRAARLASPAAQAAQLNETIRKRPYFAEARLDLVNLSLAAGDLPGATRHYREALRSTPALRRTPGGRMLAHMLIRSHLERSFRRYNVARWEEALASSREALSLDPPRETRAVALNQYAWILADKLERDLPEAEQRALEAVRLAPDVGAYADTLAWVYYKQRRYREALQRQIEAVALHERNPADGSGAWEYYYHLGAIYARLGETPAAVRNLRRALTHRPGSPEVTELLRRLAGPGLPAPGVTPSPQTPPRDPIEERGII
jgi:tetratricopeptide (TPR) repeat protein